MTGANARKIENSFTQDPQFEKEIQIRVGVVGMRHEGILHFKGYPHFDFKYDDAVEAIKAQKILGEGTRRPLLADVGLIKTMERKARLYLGGKEAASAVSAVAIIVSSPVARVIANFFMGMNKPLYPTRMFSDTEVALKWLREFKN